MLFGLCVAGLVLLELAYLVAYNLVDDYIQKRWDLNLSTCRRYHAWRARLWLMIKIESGRFGWKPTGAKHDKGCRSRNKGLIFEHTSGAQLCNFCPWEKTSQQKAEETFVEALKGIR